MYAVLEQVRCSGADCRILIAVPVHVGRVTETKVQVFMAVNVPELVAVCTLDINVLGHVVPVFLMITQNSERRGLACTICHSLAFRLLAQPFGHFLFCQLLHLFARNHARKIGRIGIFNCALRRVFQGCRGHDAFVPFSHGRHGHPGGHRSWNGGQAGHSGQLCQ